MKTKSPAVLWYTADFLTGTNLMTNEQLGKYTRLLCYQHQQGHLDEEDMLLICGTYDKKIFDKFTKDKEGKYYQHRMDLEIEKRNNFSKSRSDNRKGNPNKISKKQQSHMKNISKTYEEHMENENDNENIYIKLGIYKRIILTNKQYEKLIKDFNKEFIDNQINLLDEYVQSNNNKYKYKDFNLVLRKSIREDWFKDKIAKSTEPTWLNEKIETENYDEEYIREREEFVRSVKNG